MATIDSIQAAEGAAGIARAAARLFAAKGYEATSVREIVAAANVTKPTLYYHFGSKQGLAEALLTRPMAEFVARLGALGGSGLSPIDQLRRAIEIHFELLREEPDRARFYFSICFGGASGLRDEIHRADRAIRGEIEACARRAAAAGLIDPARVDRFVELYRGSIVASALDLLYGGGEPGAGSPDQVVRDLLDGFRPPGAGPGPDPGARP